jgi:hypothetical protein
MDSAALTLIQIQIRSHKGQTENTADYHEHIAFPLPVRIASGAMDPR